MSRGPTTIVSALALSAAFAAGATAQDIKTVGDVPSFQFSGSAVNGQGVKTLADLQGRPVLVEYWGTG